jgi:two-component system, NarL family, nitrate/nitrite sensor histidine kinase NarX
MARSHHWNLGTKLTLVATPFLLLALMLIALTLWVSWQLDGGAAAVNEAGRMRMQANRIALSVGTHEADALPALVAEFEASLDTLRRGDPERPLFVPWDDQVRRSFKLVEQDWLQFRARWTGTLPVAMNGLRDDTAAFTAHIDALVAGVETHLSRWTALMHLLQMTMMALTVLGASVLLYTGYLFVLEPLALLKNAIERIQAGDFGARVARTSTDEFGTLAEGFNGMAEHLQSLYRKLEAKVAEKTAELEEKRERLEALYAVSNLVTQSTSLDAMATGFVQRVRQVARADGALLRWAEESGQRFLMLASDKVPQALIEAEQCLEADDCHCGPADSREGARVIAIHAVDSPALPHCARAGFETVVSVPVRLHDRLMGELVLFFHARTELGQALHSLLEALNAHLASAMDNLRLTALDMEAAVSQERTFLARELHDSIAQSLAFLKIQVQLMREAMASGDARRMDAVLGEIDTGVREIYGDVRELLMHFRTRANAQDIEPALQTTLRKFEHQSGLTAVLHMQGHGLPLAPDLQVQVLHIVQEALSNVRKHARAGQVWLDVQQQPLWRFEVRDDGLGFDAEDGRIDETHVGLRIMRERAERIGAQLDVLSTAGRGCSVVLTLPASAKAAPASALLPSAFPLAQDPSNGMSVAA